MAQSALWQEGGTAGMARSESLGELEDVVGAIRRLVADQAPQPARPLAPLLLVPAFRVHRTSKPESAAGRAAPVPPVSARGRAAGAVFSAGSGQPKAAPSSDDARTLTQRIAALEAALLAARPGPGAEAAAAAGTEGKTPAPASTAEGSAPASAEAISSAAGRDATGAGAAHAAEAPPEGLQHEEALIDEESLRAIVASLLRDELRGELGARLTRNLRRTVRQEVGQALALHDLRDRPRRIAPPHPLSDPPGQPPQEPDPN